jgi:hypothetical protein
MEFNIDYPNKNTELAYIIPWPEYQQYQELPDILKHSWCVDDEDGNNLCVIEKEWLDKAVEMYKDKQYAGFWDV